MTIFGTLKVVSTKVIESEVHKVSEKYLPDMYSEKNYVRVLISNATSVKKYYT